jgi:vacuolar-type H+-ATPase subunit I/STV1
MAEELNPTPPAHHPHQTPPAQMQSADGFAVASLVTGILSIIFFWVPVMGTILGILGLVFGVISYKKRRNGMALAGAICGGLGLVFSILMIVALVAVSDSSLDTYRNSDRFYY